MEAPARAKLVGGVWLPEEDAHLVEMMLHNPRGTVWRDGKATYQIHKLDACLARIPEDRRRVCLDIGGHVGLWSMWLARAFHQVHAFEPMARHTELFRCNVTASNATLHELALGAEPGHCEVRSDGPSTGDAFITPGVGDVEIRTLDSFHFTEVDFIKIDVEGFERQVVEGARQTLLANRPLVCVEQKDKDIQNFGAGQPRALDFLIGLGMRWRLEIHGDHILDWPD